ncbi:hypothetical protein ACP70R_018649 [Stipagrostis hirtigluma subsp. patula]
MIEQSLQSTIPGLELATHGPATPHRGAALPTSPAPPTTHQTPPPTAPVTLRHPVDAGRPLPVR